MSLPVPQSERFVRRCRCPAILVAVGVFVLLGGHSRAAVPIENIRPGDRGVGLATFRGMEPSQYDVEILQVLRADGSTVDALLVRVSGPEIEAAGGIAAGMSGSPIYLDGELAAVLTYAIPDADPHYGYATPAVYLEPMLGGAPMQSVWLPAVGLPVGAGPRDPLSSLLWSGIAQAAPPRPAPADLKPGHAVGVQLARGDIHVTTYGTVSMVRGERALVFGHKFLHEGPCEYPLVRADMGAIIPSETVPFAMGSPVGPPIGTVIEDRGAGLVVDLARTPQLVPSVVSVTRGDGASRELTLELVHTPEIFRETAASATIAAADGVLDRVGPGSATLTLSLHTAGGYVIERRDVLSSTRDIGGQCAAEVRSVLDAVFYGPLFAYQPARARISIEGSTEIRSARILGCEVAPDRAAPGGSALVTATLRPARASAVRAQATLEIPEDLEPGSYLVRVHGKATDRVGTYDPWESPPAFLLPAEYCDWLSRSGRRSAIACDLVESPMDRLLAGDLAAIGFDDSGEMGTRDVPEGEDPPEPSPMAGLLGAGRVIERAFMETTWAVEGEAYGRLVVTP